MNGLELQAISCSLVMGFVYAMSFTAPALAACDTKRGARVFSQCAICHPRSADETASVGPNLWGVVGRQSGRARGYQYSSALAKLNVIWAADTLDDFLAMPATFVPGTLMAFDGLPKKIDRDAVICFLSLTN